MKRTLVAALGLACGCATTLTARERSTKATSAEMVTRCRLVGPLSGSTRNDSRHAVLDETKSAGPAYVIWVNPPPALIKTADGLIYSCDSRL